MSIKTLLKPGYKTTEFWCTIAVNIAAILGTISHVVEPKIGAGLMSLSTTIYTIARAWAKR